MTEENCQILLQQYEDFKYKDYILLYRQADGNPELSGIELARALENLKPKNVKELFLSLCSEENENPYELRCPFKINMWHEDWIYRIKLKVGQSEPLIELYDRDFNEVFRGSAKDFIERYDRHGRIIDHFESIYQARDWWMEKNDYFESISVGKPLPGEVRHLSVNIHMRFLANKYRATALTRLL